MKLKYFFCFFCITLMLAGCSSMYSSPKKDTIEVSDYITIGRYLTIQNTDNRLSLLSNMDTLAADGLYYAAWTIGNAEFYENSDGETVDLYDAQLYLLLGEFRDKVSAQNNMTKWVDAGKTNYEVFDEEEVVCNGQSYLLLTYNCVNADNPYDRGVSAFGVYDDSAICIELTCRENFEENLRAILIDFLNRCTFRAN